MDYSCNTPFSAVEPIPSRWEKRTQPQKIPFALLLFSDWGAESRKKSPLPPVALGINVRMWTRGEVIDLLLSGVVLPKVPLSASDLTFVWGETETERDRQAWGCYNGTVLHTLARHDVPWGSQRDK
jgi:hypothetical protein